MTRPITLDRSGIVARIPHAGAMCLLDAMPSVSAEAIECCATSHADPANPLRTAGGLLAPAAIEYASQAMALHGALCGDTNGDKSGDTNGEPSGEPSGGESSDSARPAAGFLASARSVKLNVARLDDVPGVITVRAQRLAGDGAQALYRFELVDDTGRPLAEGRLAVLLDTTT